MATILEHAVFNVKHSNFKDIHEMFFPVKHETKIRKSVKNAFNWKAFPFEKMEPYQYRETRRY